MSYVVHKGNRNAPCHCGSGRKFKKCCLPKEEGVKAMNNGGLKNEFRKQLEKERMKAEEEKRVIQQEQADLARKEFERKIQIETERVGEPEMMRRDQYVTMRQLQENKAILQQDMIMLLQSMDYTTSAIKTYNEFLDELDKLPLSEAKTGITAMIAKQIETLEQQLETIGQQYASSVQNRPTQVTLAALETMFIVEGAKEREIRVDGLLIESNPELAGYEPDGVVLIAPGEGGEPVDEDDEPEELRDG